MTAVAKQNGVQKKATPVVKQNGKAKPNTTKASVSVTKELAKEALESEKPLSLEERIRNFEKLRGLANQRERLMHTLNNLTKFKYNNGDSCVFLIRDEDGKEFKTTNTNLIRLVTNHLQNTLCVRKDEIENEIIDFKL